EMSHVGSLLCVPSGIYGWPPTDVAGVGAEALARVMAEAQDIDVLLLGVGEMPLPLPAPAEAALRKFGVRFDTMTTGAAVRTFNVMIAEERRVAAALIAV
ncbi:MAG: MTH938/NDUFAF3 family protein, partial [Pseudomonadota bacterium]